MKSMVWLHFWDQNLTPIIHKSKINPLIHFDKLDTTIFIAAYCTVLSSHLTYDGASLG